MRAIIFSIFALISANAFATVDGMTSTWIVVADIQEEGEWSVKEVPVIGCYGLAQGPQLQQFTAEYKVAASIGCGVDTTITENLNALSCGKVVDSEESADYSSFKKIVLDISKCADKDNAKFITMIRTAAARNFPQTVKNKIVKGKEVNLVIQK